MDKKPKILNNDWQPWLKRPFFGFIISLFTDSATPKAFKSIGLPGWQYDSAWSDGQWYKSHKVYQGLEQSTRAWLQNNSVEKINNRLESDRLKWREEILAAARQPQINLEFKLKRLLAIFRRITTYIWATHIFEYFFTPMLKQKVEKNIKGDADKFIGDASFPQKLNAAEQMVRDYKNGVGLKHLAKEYGWLRARDGFTRPYTANEIKSIATHALAQPAHRHPKIPKNLAAMFGQARELVFFRTRRTDILFEMMYLAKPLFKAAAKKYHIPYRRLKFYTLTSLIAGQPKFYDKHFAFISEGGRDYYFAKPIFPKNKLGYADKISGQTAQRGLARGVAKILMRVQDLSKVKKGDILITYMTNANFLPGMRQAKAFVTDEGGLTCHAAIVAREMHKPCIIGTKIATQVFKDGDIVEVDANKGIVRKIK